MFTVYFMFVFFRVSTKSHRSVIEYRIHRFRDCYGDYLRSYKKSETLVCLKKKTSIRNLDSQK